MATLYEHIERNKRRTILLVLLFPIVFAVFTAMVFAIVFWLLEVLSTDPTIAQEASQIAFTHTTDLLLFLLPTCWIVAMIWMGISFFCGDKWLMSGVGAIRVTEQDQPEIYRLVENLCISRGLPVPRIFIIEDNSLNAFATGRDPEHASIALTTGIIKRLERVELEGVIAHELSHVENRDIRLMLLTVAGISFFTFVGEMCLRSGLRSRSNSKDKSGMIILLVGLICMIYGYVLAPLLRLAVSRTREYQADASAAYMTRHPKALASALRKISSDSRVEALDAHPSMAAMCIASPLEKMSAFSWVSGLMATHPSIEKRIAALMEMDRGY